MDASEHASLIEQIMTLPQATTGGRRITCSSTVSMSTCWVEGEACSCIAEVSKSQQVGEGALQGGEHTRGREWEGGEQQHKPTGDVSSSKSKSSRLGRALCEGGSSRFKEPASTRCD